MIWYLDMTVKATCQLGNAVITVVTCCSTRHCTAPATSLQGDTENDLELLKPSVYKHTPHFSLHRVHAKEKLLQNLIKYCKPSWNFLKDFDISQDAAHDSYNT